MEALTQVKVFDKEECDGEWPPTNATEFVLWFSNKLADIPLEYMQSAKIEIDSICGYEGSSEARIAITYFRPETDDEKATREANDKHRQDVQMERELRTLAALKAKYGA